MRSDFFLSLWSILNKVSNGSQIGIWNTTTPQRHRGSNVSMSVTHNLNCQLDLMAASTVMKRRSNEHTKQHRGLLIQMIINRGREDINSV